MRDYVAVIDFTAANISAEDDLAAGSLFRRCGVVGCGVVWWGVVWCGVAIMEICK